MKVLSHMIMILSILPSFLKGQNSIDIENDIYKYLGKTVTNEQIDKLNKKYKMKVAYEFAGVRCFSNSFLEYQIQLDKEPQVSFFELKNNDKLLPFKLIKTDNLKIIYQKFGQPDMIDYKKNEIYYFDKKIYISFDDLGDSTGIFNKITFLEGLLSENSINNLKVFIELSNDTYLRKKNLDPRKPDFPISFGYKWFWYVVKSTNLQKISTVLELKDTSICNWEAGLDKAYEMGDIFISPSVNGWTFILGNLPMDSNEIENIKNLLNKLSNEFGESQFFCTHRVVEYHCWIKSTNGKIDRVYSYLGERGENIMIEGIPTEIEKQYNLINTLSPESKVDGYYDRDDLEYPDEELIMKIADSWSVDPSKLDDRKNLGEGLGILGKRK